MIDSERIPPQFKNGNVYVLVDIPRGARTSTN